MSIRRKYEKPAVSADYFYMSQVRYGSQYAAKQLKLSLAKLGITVRHAPIKSGKSKGKMLYDGFFYPHHLREQAFHSPVGRFVCRKALDTALPDRDVPGSGFHVTRKTYATELLRKGIGISQVSEALGQRGTDSVHKYLALDEARMRMCALSLEECGIGRCGHDR